MAWRWCSRSQRAESQVPQHRQLVINSFHSTLLFSPEGKPYFASGLHMRGLPLTTRQNCSPDGYHKHHPPLLKRVAKASLRRNDSEHILSSALIIREYPLTHPYNRHSLSRPPKMTTQGPSLPILYIQLHYNTATLTPLHTYSHPAPNHQHPGKATLPQYWGHHSPGYWANNFDQGPQSP